jgi:hypothetical protein
MLQRMPLTLSRELRFRGLVPALPWLAFACCLLATLGLWSYMLYAQRIRIQSHTAAVAEQARFHLNRGIHQRISALQYFVDEWPTRFAGRHGRYERRAGEVIAWMPGLVEVVWADQDGLLCRDSDGTAEHGAAAQACHFLAGPRRRRRSLRPGRMAFPMHSSAKTALHANSLRSPGRSATPPETRAAILWGSSTSITSGKPIWAKPV